jgi:CRP-like cAMP-binding protein
MLRKLLLTGLIIWLPVDLRPCVALAVSMLSCCCLNYFKPHRNPMVFAFANAANALETLALISVMILSNYLLMEKGTLTRGGIGAYLITLDALLVVFAAMAVAWILSQMIKRRKKDKIERTRTRSRMLHQNGVIKLVEDGVGGVILPESRQHSGSPIESDMMDYDGDKMLKNLDQSERKLKMKQEYNMRKHRARIKARLEARLYLHRSRALQNCTLFEGMDADRSRTVLEKMKFHMYKKGEVICRQGDEATEFFVIAKGSVQVGVDHLIEDIGASTPATSSDNALADSPACPKTAGNRISVHENVKVLPKLSFFGESALSDEDDEGGRTLKRVRNATITAIEVTHVCILTRAMLDELMAENDLPANVLKRARKEGRRRSVSLLRRRSTAVHAISMTRKIDDPPSASESLVNKKTSGSGSGGGLGTAGAALYNMTSGTVDV